MPYRRIQDETSLAHTNVRVVDGREVHEDIVVPVLFNGNDLSDLAVGGEGVGAGELFFGEKTIDPDSQIMVLNYLSEFNKTILALQGTGQSDSLYTIKISGSEKLKGRTTASCLDWGYMGKIVLPAGTLLEIYVKNTYKLTANYAASILVK